MRFLLAVALAALATLVLAGCVRATFTKTSETFEEQASEIEPPVFVDHLPPRAYESVGVIQVIAPQGSSLTEIIHAAAVQGRKVGCDVVVDRGIHRTGGVDHRRWTVVVAGVEQGPPVGEVPSARPSPALGFIGIAPRASAPMQQTVVYQQAPIPPDTREFICGIFSSDGGGGAAAIASSPPAPRTPSVPKALGDPPVGAGGFAFKATADESRQACERAGHAYTPATSGPDTCDGLVTTIGAAARAQLTYCAGKLCVVALVVDDAAGVALARSMMRWKAALADRYGDPTATHSQVPTSCAADVTPCLIDGSAHIDFEWRWPSHERVVVSHEVDAASKPHVRLTYTAAVGPTTAPGL